MEYNINQFELLKSHSHESLVVYQIFIGYIFATSLELNVKTWFFCRSAFDITCCTCNNKVSNNSSYSTDKKILTATKINLTFFSEQPT